MLGDAPAPRSEQARLQVELLENERQLETLGGSESVLEAELECLKSVLDHPQRYPVSYTHLDVYKRQDYTLTLPGVSAGGLAIDRVKPKWPDRM